MSRGREKGRRGEGEKGRRGEGEKGRRGEGRGTTTTTLRFNLNIEDLTKSFIS